MIHVLQDLMREMQPQTNIQVFSLHISGPWTAQLTAYKSKYTFKINTNSDP